MAGESSVERLAKLSLPAKLGILAGVLLVLGLVYYNFFYTDMVDEQKGLIATKARQKEDEKRLEKRRTEFQELMRQKDDVEKRLRTNSIKLPETSELPAVFQHLETQAATANVRIVNRVLEKEVPVETYVKVPVRMEVSGDFYQLNNYFKLLGETARIITIENLFIGEPRREPERVVLIARFTASTFRQADKPAAKPSPNAPPPPPPTPEAPPAAPATPPATAPAPGAPVKAESGPTITPIAPVPAGQAGGTK